MLKKMKKTNVVMSIIASLAIMANAEVNNSVTVNSIDVIGKNQVTENIQEELLKIPGGTNLINIDKITTSKATLAEVLKTEPGIIIQEFFGGNDQPRLNVRGSGIQSNPVNDGVNLLFDGLSINQADGSFVIGVINAAQNSAISVFRGSNAMSLGSATLGGALDFTPKTGLSSESFVEIQAGSHSTKNINIGLGGVNDKLDYYISGSYAESDGYKEMSSSQRKDFTANFGYQISDNVENRTHINYSDNFFEIPFVIPKTVAAEHSDSVLGDGYAGIYDTLLNNYNRQPLRDTQQVRISNKTTFNTNDNIIYQVGVYAEDMNDTFKSPLEYDISDNQNVGLNLGAKGKKLFKNDDKYEISLNYSKGSMPVEYWVTNPTDGSKLYQFGDLDRDADNLVLNTQYNFPISADIEFIADLQYIRNTRYIDGTISTYTSTATTTIDEKSTYDALNPKLGLIYKINNDINFYTNISRSMQAPTFSQLVSRSVSPAIAIAGTAYAEYYSGGDYVDLEAQEALTYEIGTKGTYEDSSWQVSYYYSKVSDELITYADSTGSNTVTSNYTDKTTHQGIELGFSQVLTKNISANIVYNYNDFTFDEGVYKGNQIAGVPKQTIYLELAYNMGDKFFIAPNVKFQPDDNYADHSNTTKQDSFSLLGLKVSYKPQADLTFYANLNNITDEVYESTFVVKDSLSESEPGFITGDGFNYSVGMKYTF